MVLTESNYKLKKGDLAPDFSLRATNEKTYSLKDFKKSRALLIIFMCNHCPYVLAKLEELNRIALDFKNKGLTVIGINSNESKNYPEDGFDIMKKYVDAGKINFLFSQVSRTGRGMNFNLFFFDHAGTSTNQIQFTCPFPVVILTID